MRRLIIATSAICAATAVYAADVKVGSLTIEDVWARSAQTGQMTGAFMRIQNSGAADKIISASCDAAKATELHATQMSDGVMKMRPVSAMEIPAMGELSLKPGGYHIMLIGLNRPLVAGETLPIKVIFEKAGAVTLNAIIKDKAAPLSRDMQSQ